MQVSARAHGNQVLLRRFPNNRLKNYTPFSVTLNGVVFWLDCTLLSVTLIGVTMKNPFTFGRVVDGKDYCPRPEQEALLTQSIRSGHNVAVIGQRRVGKTSIILRTANAQPGAHLLYVDLLAVNTVAEIGERIGRAYIKLGHVNGFLQNAMKLFAKLRPSLSFDPLTGTPSVGLSVKRSQSMQTLEDVLDQLLEGHKRDPLVVVFDEFQDVLRVEDPQKALALMRGKIQHHGDLPYIFSGSIRNKMRTIFNDPDSAFFKSAITLELEPLNVEQFESFLRKHFESGKRTTDPDLFQNIADLGIQITGDVQQLCWALWEASEPGDIVDKNTITKALERIFTLERISYEDTVSELTDVQRRCLVSLVKTGGQSIHSKLFKETSGVAQSSSITKAVNRLVERRIVYKHRKTYQAANPFFAVWLSQKEYL